MAGRGSRTQTELSKTLQMEQKKINFQEDFVVSDVKICNMQSTGVGGASFKVISVFPKVLAKKVPQEHVSVVKKSGRNSAPSSNDIDVFLGLYAVAYRGQKHSIEF